MDEREPSRDDLQTAQADLERAALLVKLAARAYTAESRKAAAEALYDALKLIRRWVDPPQLPMT